MRIHHKILTLSAMALSIITSCGYAALSHQKTDSKMAIHYLEAKLNAEVGPYEVADLIKNKDQNSYDVIIDVRSAEEFAKGHVPGAINIPNGKIEGTSADQLTKKGTNYVYCYNLTCHLAAHVALDWAKKGYPVKEMIGGFTTWKESGFPVEPTDGTCDKDK